MIVFFNFFHLFLSSLPPYHHHSHPFVTLFTPEYHWYLFSWILSLKLLRDTNNIYQHILCENGAKINKENVWKMNDFSFHSFSSLSCWFFFFIIITILIFSISSDNNKFNSTVIILSGKGKDINHLQVNCDLIFFSLTFYSFNEKWNFQHDHHHDNMLFLSSSFLLFA